MKFNREKCLAEFIVKLDWNELKKEINTAIEEGERSPENFKIDFSDDLLIPVSLLFDGRRGVYMANAVLDMFGLTNFAESYLDGEGYSDVTYHPDIWMEFIEPFASTLAERIASEFDLGDMGMEFGFNDNGDYCFFLYVPEDFSPVPLS